jgi:hypothetical protein
LNRPSKLAEITAFSPCRASAIQFFVLFVICRIKKLYRRHQITREKSMSIRYLALALYQSMKEISRLEAEIAAAPWSRKTALAAALAREQANQRALKRLLDGAKESGR